MNDTSARAQKSRLTRRSQPRQRQQDELRQRQEVKLRAARRLIDAGYGIVPVAPDAKRPINAHGFNSPVRDWKEFLGFVRLCPYCNYGIVTGGDKGLVVIDVDGDKGLASYRELEKRHGALPKTMTVETPRGYHLYFQSDVSNLRSVNALCEGIDVRANGGYVVGPGCWLGDGPTYRYFRGRSPADVGRSALPDWLAKLIGERSAPRPSTSNGRIPEGVRNQTLTFIAGRLVNAGVHGPDLENALGEVNASQADPPLGEAEVRGIARSVGKYAAMETVGDEAERVMQAVLIQKFARGEHLLYAADGRFWHYDGIFWQVLDEALLRKYVLEATSGLPGRRGGTSTVMNQTINLLKARCAREGDSLRFHTDPPMVINCRNCEVWILEDGRKERRPHRPESFLRHCFNADFDPEAKCEAYDHALLQIFGPTDDPRGMADFWDELMGYILQPRRPDALIVIGVGNGSNGKTSLIQLLTHLIGRDLVLATDIKSLEGARFLVGSLDGKLLLLDDDVAAGTRLPDGALKKLSEEKIITGEHKFGPPFTFTCRVVPVLLCNNPPSTADLSEGLRRRLVVVPFTRHFALGEVDRGLFRRIIKEESSGVLNRYLEGLARLMKRNWDFLPPRDVTIATRGFLKEANPLPAFIEEACRKDGDSTVKDLFERYRTWCDDSGIKYQQQRTNFTRNLKSLGFRVGHSNRGAKVWGLAPL